jgi:hypothetical protein
MRISYELHGLLEAEAAAGPLQQFEAWFKAAVECKVRGNRCCLFGYLAGLLCANSRPGMQRCAESTLRFTAAGAN